MQKHANIREARGGYDRDMIREVVVNDTDLMEISSVKELRTWKAYK